MPARPENINHNISSSRPDLVPPSVLQPIGCQVAVHMHPTQDNKKGIILPDGSENPHQTNICTVIAAGPDCKQVKRGDHVFVLHTLATNLYHNGHMYIFLEEKFIACIIDRNALPEGFVPKFA